MRIRRMAVVLLMTVGSLLCGGCFTIALEGTDIASKKAAESDVAVVKEAGEVTQKGVQKVKAAKKKVIEEVKEAVE